MTWSGIQIDEAIKSCLPANGKTWESKLQALARCLTALDGLDDDTCRLAVEEWHRRTRVRARTPDDAWEFFLDAEALVLWPKVYPVLVAQAKRMDNPPELAHLHPKLALLGRLCKLLAEHWRKQRKPFFLTCENAGIFLGCSSKEASRKFQVLQRLGILRLIEKGSYKGPGSTFVYMPDEIPFDIREGYTPAKRPRSIPAHASRPTYTADDFATWTRNTIRSRAIRLTLTVDGDRWHFRAADNGQLLLTFLPATGWRFTPADPTHVHCPDWTAALRLAEELLAQRPPLTALDFLTQPTDRKPS